MLEIDSLSRSFNGRRLLAEVSLRLAPGEYVAIQPGDQVEQRRLAHPRLPDDRHILPRRQPQGHLDHRNAPQIH
jgi:hypothetical protein